MPCICHEPLYLRDHQIRVKRKPARCLLIAKESCALGLCPIPFCCCDQKQHRRGKSVFGLLSIITGKSRQELRASYSVKDRETNAAMLPACCCQCELASLSNGQGSAGCEALPTFRVGLSTSTNHQDNPVYTFPQDNLDNSSTGVPDPGASTVSNPELWRCQGRLHSTGAHL